MLTERKPHGWMVCYAFMLAFFLVMVPSLAFADTYVATEDSAVRAAMVYLGYDPDEGESTNKLVTAFYDATSGDEYTGWQSFVNGLYQPLATVNYNEQWWSPADGFMFSNQVDRARADAANIYAAWKKTSGGGSSGGGSSIDVSSGLSDSYTLYAVGTYVDALVWTDPTKYMTITGQGTLNITNKTAFADRLSQLGCNYIAFVYQPKQTKTGTGSFSAMLWSFASATPIDIQLSYVEGTPTYIDAVVSSESTLYRYAYTNWGHFNVDNTGNLTGYLDFTYSGLSNSGNSYTITGVDRNNYTTWVLVTDASGSIGPEPEPEPEPEPPTPDPVPPDPDTPTPDPPRDPTPPTPDPTQPSQTIDLQGIIDRLDIIIRNQAILINWLDDAFASVNANIQWLGSLFDNLTEWLSSINQNIQWLGELIDESFGWLWEVLENLQGSIDGGITRITTWLEMIYNKIGGQGGTVSRPNIDTPTPWDDFLSWLEGILQRLLDLIFGVTPAALQNLLSGLADLTTKFPFSIPWDLAALFALFAHAPVTPVADVPLMVPFANAPLPIHVDCTAWEGLASIMRDGETILFAAWLVMETPNFYRHLNNVSGAD